ncbi:MAG: cytochrome P450 [Anaerolineae bacterium]|jgi:cytochrome P450
MNVQNRTPRYPPGPKERFPMQFVLRFGADRLGFLREMAAYGDIAHMQTRGLHFYLINHPELIQDVLVTHHRSFVKSRALQVARRLLGDGLLTSEGELHLRQRRLMQPAFHRQRMAAYSQVMASYAEQTAERWQTLGNGAAVDMAQEMMRLTLAIVGKALFDADVEGEAAEIGQALTEALHAVNRLLLPGGELAEKLPLPASQRAEQARQRLDATIYRIIAQRRASAEDRGDLVSMLLAAQDEQGGMSDVQVRDEAMTLFLAGHETTANALTWTWYLLSQNPAEERRLHKELDQVLAGRTPTLDDLPHLPYTRMVLSEAMRLYPPAYAIGRQVVEPYSVRDYVIEPGATVFISQYVMHRDPRYWFDFERFDPNRWTPEAQARRPKFSYFPFSAGPRVCIGEGFAWTEGLLALATLAQRWQARLVLGQPVALEPLITLRPKHGMRMTLHRRG